MARHYKSTHSGELSQGEILSNVWEFVYYRERAKKVLFDRVVHTLVVVMSADCDLYWDYARRYNKRQATDKKLLSHVLLADVSDEQRFREALGQQARNTIEAAEKDQDPRYHCLSNVPLHFGPEPSLTRLFVDFKSAFSIRSQELYRQIRTGKIRRHCCVVPPYVHHMTQRGFNYLGRIGVDD